MMMTCYLEDTAARHQLLHGSFCNRLSLTSRALVLDPSTSAPSRWLNPHSLTSSFGHLTRNGTVVSETGYIKGTQKLKSKYLFSREGTRARMFICSYGVLALIKLYHFLRPQISSAPFQSQFRSSMIHLAHPKVRIF